MLLPNIENRKNIWMIQCRRRARFLHKALQPIRIRRVRPRQNLDGDDAIQPRVPRPIHFSHPSSSDEGLDVVGTKLCAGSKRHLKPWIISDLMAEALRLDSWLKNSRFVSGY